MAQPGDPFELAQAPIARPDPIPRPGPIERPGSAPQRRTAPARPSNPFFEIDPPKPAAKPVNPFFEIDPPAAQSVPGKGEQPEAPAVGMAEEPTGPGRFAKQAGTPPLNPQKIGDYDVKQLQGILDKTDPKLREQILQEWADEKVKAERAQGGMKAVATWIDDRVRTPARGSIVGSWADEANAAIYSLAGIPYDMQLAYEQAKDRARDSEATTLFNIPNPLSSVVGPESIPFTTASGEKLLGAIGSTWMFPQANLLRGTGYVPRTVNATATGAGYGALYGAGEGNSLGERLLNAGVGGAVGGGFGLATPAIQNVATAPVNALARYFNRPQGAIAGMDKNAVRKVAETGFDDPAAAATYRARSADLGPEGMLADMGLNLRMDAARIARNPGEGRSTIINALNARREGAQGRITQDVDAALGAPLPLPQTVESLKRQASAFARPHYDQFYQTPIPPSQDLVTAVQRVPASAYSKARELAAAEGYDLAQIANTGRGLDYIKRGVDDLAYNAKPGSNEARVYQGLARDIRNATDDVLSPGGTPQTRAQSPWAQGRRMAGEGLQVEEAAQQGQKAFSRNLSPDQMRMDMRNMTPVQTGAYNLGARDQIRQTMGNAATTMGSAGDNAARRMLGADNAREKLALIAGPQNADRITRRLNAEAEFAQTRNDAIANSITSTMQAAGKKWPAPDGGAEARSELMKSSIQGQVMAMGHRIVNAVRGNALNERLLREQADAARMLVAQGADRDAIARELIRFANGNRLTGQRRSAIEAVVREIMRQPRSLAIEGATQ